VKGVKNTIENIQISANILYGDNTYLIDKCQEYLNDRQKLKIFCNNCKKYFEKSSNKFIHSKQGCLCSIKNSKLTINQIQEKSNILNNSKYIIVERNDNNLKIHCKECNSEFSQKYGKHLYQKQGCPKCAKNIKLTIDEIINRSNIIYNHKYLILDQEYINNRTKITIKCQKCGKTFLQSADNHLKGKIGCDCLIKSKGETAIINFLLKENIHFENQKRFDNCKNILTLPFDFYLPAYNLTIEFDGRQHFNINTKFYTPEIEKNDKIKTNFCINNNINLLRIKYNENIEEKIKNYLYEKI